MIKIIWDYVIKEWQLQRVLRGPPFKFIFTLLLGAALALLVADWRYEGIVQTLKERIEVQKDQVASKDALIIEYRQRLHLAPTDETRYSVMSNGELRDSTLKVASEIRTYVQESDIRQRKLVDSHMTQMRNAATEEERSRVWHQQTAQLTQIYFDMNATYDKKYKISASLLRDELIRRLPEGYSDKKHALYYERPTNMQGMVQVADDLEKLARSLR
jgi:hypothetical protein